ncbi:MAG: STAS domain-containing protein [Pseudomonadota bacterium]
MSLEINSFETDGSLIYRLVGRLDTNTSPDFEATLTEQLSKGRQRFMIDLGAIDYISSAGLRVFLMLAKKVGRGKGKMVLYGMSDHVKEVFDIAGFTKIFTIEPDAAAAQTHFG